MAFICGSMHSQEEDDYEVLCPFESPSPRKPSKRRHIFSSRSNKNDKNPYSDRGLDKFEALLADLDHKRQKILTQKGSEDVSMVKFVYRSPDEVRPIVVKLRDQRKHVNTSLLEISSPETEDDHQKNVALIKVNNGGNKAEEGKRAKTLVDKHTKKIGIDQWERKIGKWWKPSYYLPLFMILILVLLMFTTRSFAILCTSFGLYLVPIVNKRLYNARRSQRRSPKKST